MNNIISVKLKKICINSLYLPGIFFVFSIILFITIPIGDLASPPKANGNTEINAAYRNGAEFANCTFEKLYYSNFDYYVGSKKIGSYYYSLSDNSCIFVLVSSENLHSKELVISNYNTIAKLSEPDDSFENFVSQFSNDINWTEQGLISFSSSFVVDEINYSTPVYYVLFFVTLIVLIISLKFILTEILYIFKPQLYPSFRMLKKFGFSKNEYANIENELQNKLKLNSGSIYITENFLIEFGMISMDIIPLKDIIWMYHYSHWNNPFTLHKKISYGLCVYTNPYHRFIFHMKPKDIITEVETYFSLNYPDIISEFTQEKREQILKK